MWHLSIRCAIASSSFLPLRKSHHHVVAECDLTISDRPFRCWRLCIDHTCLFQSDESTFVVPFKVQLVCTVLNEDLSHGQPLTLKIAQKHLGEIVNWGRFNELLPSLCF